MIEVHFGFHSPEAVGDGRRDHTVGNVADRADTRGVNGAEGEKEGPGGACLDTGGSELIAEGSFEGSSTGLESEGLGSVVCHHLLDSPGDIVQRLVPADRLELTGASRPDSLEWGR